MAEIVKLIKHSSGKDPNQLKKSEVITELMALVGGKKSWYKVHKVARLKALLQVVRQDELIRQWLLEENEIRAEKAKINQRLSGKVAGQELKIKSLEQKVVEYVHKFFDALQKQATFSESLLDFNESEIVHAWKWIRNQADRIRKRSQQDILETRDDARDIYLQWRQSPEGQEWINNFLSQCNHRCPECHKRLINDNITIDHKLPVSHYPWTAWDKENMWILCYQCNQTKGNKKWSEYVNGVKTYRGDAAYQRVIKYSPGSKS